MSDVTEDDPNAMRDAMRKLTGNFAPRNAQENGAESTRAESPHRGRRPRA